ncbi:MAG: hypothetical protein ACE5Q6_21495 [Dehalococcoidia bacterium]
MGEFAIKFTGGTASNGGLLKFKCLVEYPTELDTYLPADLKKQTDGKGTTILPFSDGRGNFEADSLLQAEAVEAEIKGKLQTAYHNLLEGRKRIQQWTGVREFDLTTAD